MNTTPTRITVEERERAILDVVRKNGADGATVKEIYETTREKLGDPVTIQAYYKLLARMEATGRLKASNIEDGEKRFALAPYLHPENALDLDEVYALMEELEPTDAIARVIDAREYFEERRKDTLVRAAEALLEEDPRDLMARMLLDRARELGADIEMLHSEELRDPELEGRARAQLRDLDHLAYRMLGLTRWAMDIPSEVAGRQGTDGARGSPSLSTSCACERRSARGSLAIERLSESMSTRWRTLRNGTGGRSPAAMAAPTRGSSR